MNFLEFYSNLNDCYLCNEKLIIYDDTIYCLNCRFVSGGETFKLILINKYIIWLSIYFHNEIYFIRSNSATNKSNIYKLITNKNGINSQLIFEKDLIKFSPDNLKFELENYINKVLKLKSFI